ncbi:uncharacterized protein LOC143057454 [Mytilus galloprovincialis]|uniref:uncharacterized protein LOC143057454 n=1 Tax=Mytilus galloprovincialis TaxID=29158 RepID=UPI003F7C90C9
MGIPGITAKTIKRREREIKIPNYDVAKDSCLRVIEEEIECMSKSIPQEEAATPEGLKAKYDMCWQKRGSGRSYNSPSGIGSILGQHTGKVMGFKVCSTLCRICDTVSTSRKEPNLHDCPRNWDKSAKAMEADTAARLLKILEETTGLQVDTLIMDDDSSTISKVKQALGHDVEKWSDINHSTKSVSNALYTLQKKHKVFSKDVIGYFKRCFSYAVKQNKNDKDHLRQNILAIVPHSFGIHENCGAWCRASENHKYKSLPNGKCLSGDDLYKDLCIIFKTMANNAHVQISTMRFN